MIPTDMARDATGSRWTVLYDGECGFCKWMLAGLLRLDADRRLRPLALGTPEADALLSDLTPEQRNASWHLVAPNGERESAGDAAPALFELLRGGSLPAKALSAAQPVTNKAYDWVAAHRSQLSRFVPSSWKRGAGEKIRRHAV
jgi:predicted DCC family thiol-disulfide oxidoreductase YuxK